jgi:heme/copper-type cytochrome/quinol oxidase subunit 3
MKPAQSGPSVKGPPGRSDLQALIEARIRKLERTAGNGLWGTVIFLLVSFAAFNGFAILPDMPVTLRQKLGAPPPIDLISLALVIYAFSGIILTFARMTSNTGSYRGFQHAAFLTGFYAFYHLSGGLTENFWAVFFAGLSVMGLESYQLWTRNSAAIRKQQQYLADLRAGRPIVFDDEDEEVED